VLTATAVMTEAAFIVEYYSKDNWYITKQGLSKNIFPEVLGNHRLSDYTVAAPLLLGVTKTYLTVL